MKYELNDGGVQHGRIRMFLKLDSSDGNGGHLPGWARKAVDYGLIELKTIELKKHGLGVEVGWRTDGDAACAHLELPKSIATVEQCEEIADILQEYIEGLVREMIRFQRFQKAVAEAAK